MKWVGLTGGLGTGKSTVSQMLICRGIPVVDADRIAREVVEGGQGPALPQIRQDFGAEVFRADGSLDRQKLANSVFGHPQKLSQLEKIIHPFVKEEVLRQRQWLQDQHCKWAFYDVPLLFEKKLEDQFDFIVVVSTSDVNTQIQRLKLRNNWNEDEIVKRMKSQMPLSEKVSQADYVIRNDADLISLEKQVDTMVQMLNDLWQDEGTM